MDRLTITAATLLAGVILQTQAFAQLAAGAGISAATNVATTADSMEKIAQKNWRKAMANNLVSEGGCFHASYPNYVWEKVDCKAAPAVSHPVSHKQSAALVADTVADTVGDGNDYTAQAHGLIGFATGDLQTAGVTSEKGEGGAGDTDGTGQYELQINTNSDQTTSVCAGGNSGCHVWQQFIYASQYAKTSILNSFGADKAPGLYMQYWLLDFGPNCPHNWTSNNKVDCYLNSPKAEPPDVPASDLGDVQMTASTMAGGKDVMGFFYKTDAYIVSDNDNVLQIATVWKQAEFNVFGNGDSSQAVFNSGSSITVSLHVLDGTDIAPICSNHYGTSAASDGTTAETNNLILGICTSSIDAGPTIRFTESFNTGRTAPPPIVIVPPGGPVAPVH